MTTTLYRMPVRASMSARLDGVSVCVSRPALTARPAREPCEVRIKNRMSLSAAIPLAAARKDRARPSIVAAPPFFELYCTLIGPLPKRPATTRAAPVRLASKYALIAEKAEGHYAHLTSIFNGVRRRNRRRNGQNKSDERRAERGCTAFLSTGHVKEPDPLCTRPVEHPDRLGRRLQQDLAALSFEIGFSFRRQVHVAHLTRTNDDLVAPFLEEKFCLIL